MRNVKYYRWNNEMGSEREREREEGGERKTGERGGRANEAPLFDISYSTFSAVAAATSAAEMN